jgi:hypothetical protein
LQAVITISGAFFLSFFFYTTTGLMANNSKKLRYFLILTNYDRDIIGIKDPQDFIRVRVLTIWLRMYIGGRPISYGFQGSIGFQRYWVWQNGSRFKTGLSFCQLYKEIIMKTDDLTQVKHIGAARMKVLNDSGITTIKKLYEIPLEKLAQVETIGGHYAKLIKEAVLEVYAPSAEEIVAKTSAAKEKQIEPVDQGLQKQIKILNRRLKQANEKLKPLGKKKYLQLYVDFKKRSKTLKRHLNKLDNLETNLPQKVREKIIKKADALIATIKTVGKKPKKRTYKSLSREIRSFTKSLRKISA